MRNDVDLHWRGGLSGHKRKDAILGLLFKSYQDQWIQAENNFRRGHSKGYRAERAGEVTLNVRDGEHISGSSDNEGIFVGQTYKVKTERWDALVGDFDQPSLCKIDVQGAVMLVLEGMGGILPKVDVFIIESNVFAPAGDDVHRIMAFLGARKFVLYDIADVIRRPIDNALGCLDLVFVKEDSRFRQEKLAGVIRDPL